MSQSMSEECEKNNALTVPEILADFFLKKIEMPNHSDESDHRSKSKRKKSKHKKHKHKKSKHKHRHGSSDSSNRDSDFSSKIVQDVSSSEEMGIKRLKKIKKMKLQSVDMTILHTVTTCEDGQNKEKSDPSNSSNSENLVYYGPSLELLLSGVESRSTEKIDSVTSVEDSKDQKNCDLNSDLNKTENSFTSNSNLNVSVQKSSVEHPDSPALSQVKDSEVEQENAHDNNVPIIDKEHSVRDKNDADKGSISPEKVSSDKIESVQKNTNCEEVSQSIEKNDNDTKQTDSHSKTKQKCKDGKKKHSRSHSRSTSQSRHHSPKSKHRKRRSRSSSRDSHHSHKKRKRHSHSRSHSHERFKSHKNKRKSHSRSRSRSMGRRRGRNLRSQSPYAKRRHQRSRSRSRSFSRHRRRSNSRSRRNSHSSRHQERSLSKSRHKSKSYRRRNSFSRSRSKSKSRQRKNSKEKSRSSSKTKEKHSSQSSSKIDQAKILETARKNILKMMQNGTLPEGLPVENLKKDQLVSIQAGGKSVQELTDFCQRLSQRENAEESDNEDKDEKPDDETGFIHHPFRVKEPGMIKLNIKNAVQLPIKTHAQKVAETARLSSQFPVSSGNQHKQKELEWIPVVPASTKNETKSNVTTVSAVASTKKPAAVETKHIVTQVPPPVSSIPVPIMYPAASSEAPVMDVQVIAPPLVPPPIPPPLPPPMPAVQPPMPPPAVFQMPVQPIMPSFTMPNQEMIHSYVPAPAIVQSPALVFKTPKKLDIPAIIARRFQALTKLQENPDDPEALKVINDAQESIQEWVESQQVPGLFTGSTDAKVLTAAELCGPKFYKFRKDILSHAPPVTEGKGMSLLKKMGWNPGEGLGKNKEGSLEPLMLDIKMDKKGLVSEGENSKKGVSSFTKELQGKHPVSALMELCSKRRWKPPLYTCVLDQGPSHRKLFCFKVEVNNVTYQPVNPCSNKKVAKADAAVLCLQSLNVLPKTA